MYLSLIVCGRNDDYGRGFNNRLQKSLDNIAVVGDKHALSAEVILVEWNSYEDRPKLSDSIEWKSDTISLRVIKVPKLIHNSVIRTKRDAKRVNNIDFFEYIAKNTGARRANGKFLLFFNADIILNEDLIKHLSTKDVLSEMFFYRVDKYELRRPLPDDADVFARLEKCNNAGYMNRGSRKSRKAFVYNKASGDFFLIAKSKFEEMKGFAEILCCGSGLDTMSLYCAMCVCSQKIFRKNMKIFHQRHKTRRSYYSNGNCILYHIPTKEWYDKALSSMKKTRVNQNPNGNQWGLLGVNLEEVEL